ncbi:AMIN domain-containing protein [Melittangium boletus]|uniref:AMIN domain-containing protein n=1 Tax=Melittangium boletus DSM 14713 TaxID=1294270 RepID=A0A286NV78_9BACT|nr:AMIN domain-containing protein [Melittangium boletus]ATB26997.1 AMIN domain-containing protein [Melittangium boletus DSM 14713]
MRSFIEKSSLKVLVLALLSCVLGPARALAQEAGNLNSITSVNVRGGTVEIVGTKKPNFTTFSLTDPPRLVIDIAEATFSGVKEDIPVGNGTITAIRTAGYGSDDSSIARVLIGYAREVETDIQARGNTLVVSVAGGGGAVVAAAPTGTTPTPTTTPGTTPAQAPQATGAEPQEERAVAQAAQAAQEERKRQDAAAAQAAQAAQEERKRQEAAAAQAAKATADAEAEARRQAEARAEADRKAQEDAKRVAAQQAEQQRLQSERAAQAEKQRQQEEARAAAEQKNRQAAEEKARRDAEAQAAAEARQRQQAEARAAAEQKRREEAQARREEAQAAAEEKQRLREEARQARVAQAEQGSRAAVSSRRKMLTLVGFKQEAESSRIFIRTDEPVRYSVSKGERMVVLELENTRVDVNNTRMLDTSFFDTVVNRVEAEPGPSQTVRVAIRLKQQVPYQTHQQGNELSIEFPRPARR